MLELNWEGKNWAFRNWREADYTFQYHRLQNSLIFSLVSIVWLFSHFLIPNFQKHIFVSYAFLKNKCNFYIFLTREKTMFVNCVWYCHGARCHKSIPGEMYGWVVLYLSLKPRLWSMNDYTVVNLLAFGETEHSSLFNVTR